MLSPQDPDASQEDDVQYEEFLSDDELRRQIVKMPAGNVARHVEGNRTLHDIH